MAEFIEREEAINAVFGAMADGRAVFPALLNLPAADVRPVVRGKWERIEDDFGKYDRCSNCGKEYYFGPIVTMHYCPNCGCAMEES